MLAKNKIAGDTGEAEVIKLVQCPNCGKALQKLPLNYPLYDAQCTGCSFRAQVKTNLSKPKSTVFGAGWEIIDKVLKAGFLSPPLFLNFKWIDKGVRHQEIRFYPFVPRKNLQKYRLSPEARRANYWMFRYVGMNDLPYFTVYPEGAMRGHKTSKKHWAFTPQGRARVRPVDKSADSSFRRRASGCGNRKFQFTECAICEKESLLGTKPQAHQQPHW